MASYREEARRPAKEVIEHLYEVILGTPEFVLSDGTVARVEAFYSPETSADGELTCGFDVVLEHGAHLEFSLRLSGWGRPVPPPPPESGVHWENPG
jgi:hypothetical protein